MLALGDPGLPLDAAIAEVAAWYAGHGLPPAFSVPLPALAPLDAALAERGWRAELTTHVLTSALSTPSMQSGDSALSRPGMQPADSALSTRSMRPGDFALSTPGMRGVVVGLEGWPPVGWDEVYRGPEPLPPGALAILAGPPIVTFAAVRDDEQRVVATGRGVVTGEWLGIAAVEVRPDHRGRGLAVAVTDALRGWGARHGAARAYLQVADDNAAARTLYARLGFTHHHTYRQRVPGPPRPGLRLPEPAQPWSRMP